MGLSIPTLSTGIMTSLPPARAGMGSGLNSAAREIGSALGVAVVGTVLASHVANALPASLQEHADSTWGAVNGAVTRPKRLVVCLSCWFPEPVARSGGAVKGERTRGEVTCG